MDKYRYVLEGFFKRKMNNSRFKSFCIDSLDYRPVSFRAPFLKYNACVNTVMAQHRLVAVNADIYARDAGNMIDPDTIVEKLNTKLPDGSIILCHEREHTLEALKTLIPIWKEQNYKFVTLQAIEVE